MTHGEKTLTFSDDHEMVRTRRKQQLGRAALDVHRAEHLRQLEPCSWVIQRRVWERSSGG